MYYNVFSNYGYAWERREKELLTRSEGRGQRFESSRVRQYRID